SNAQSARVVMGYVAPAPWPSAEGEQALAGQPINEGTAQKDAEAEVKNAKPLSHNAYKVQLARVAVKRAILKAASGGAALSANRIASTPIIRTSARRCAGRASSFSPSRTRLYLARTM